VKPYGEEYYARHGLAADRPALWWYARVVRRLRPRGGRLLDFGCGTGHLLRRLSEHFEAYGYDASAEARGVCRLTAPDAVVLEEWESLAEASLDAIVSLHTFEHLPQPRPVVERLVARLAPGGVLFFVVPNPGGFGHRLKGKQWFAYRDPTHCSLLSRGEWLTLVRRIGLKVRWVRGDGMWDPPYVPFLPFGLQRVLFGAPAGMQMVLPLRRPFLPAVLGECLLVAAERPAAATGARRRETGVS
jgi:SAM-dependent methyltransferase